MAKTTLQGSAHYGSFGKEIGVYRYELSRYTEDYDRKADRELVFIMLNPSTATETINDPTVRRCEGFMQSWGFKYLTVLNIFALRATDPKELYTHPDPIGKSNDYVIEAAARRRRGGQRALIVCAWGEHGKLYDRGQYVRRLLLKAGAMPHFLDLNKSGEPKHPLYLRSDLKPIRWTLSKEEAKRWL